MAVEIMGAGGTVAAVQEPGTIVAASPPSRVAAVSGILSSGTPYEGSYEAPALFTRQVFPTKSKTMAEDFAVRAINYTEAPNDSGITLTIGG